MKNAIVILNYNDWRITDKLVKNIVEYKSLNNIIIVDNFSTDNSYENLNKKYKNNRKIDIIKTTENKGYAVGNNFGIRYAIKKYNPDNIFIANPDIFFEENIIFDIEEVLKNNPKIAVVAPMVSKGYNSWKLPNYFSTLASLFLLLNKKFGNKVYSGQRKNKINYVDVVAGSLFVIKKQAFEEIGGFDEDTFLYYEENILAFKLKSLGYKSVILGNITYDHNHGTTVKKVFKSKVKVFTIIVNSIKIYDYKYLKINVFQKIIFNLFVIIAYIERIIYDIIFRFILYVRRKNDSN